MSANDIDFRRFRSLLPNGVVSNPVRAIQNFMVQFGLKVTMETNTTESGEYECICKVTHDGGKYECAVSGVGKTARSAKERAHKVMLDYLNSNNYEKLEELFNSIQA